MILAETKGTMLNTKNGQAHTKRAREKTAKTQEASYTWTKNQASNGHGVEGSACTRVLVQDV